ncbi:hypothetical protein SUDANB176_02474 [Streptomyces sp. enrichment culture]|uniref:hypothetical protein n=1 Tax=Streptomyces sp. enrichment culture TaxID=1795815 RepID=UPI003F552AB3
MDTSWPRAYRQVTIPRGGRGLGPGGRGLRVGLLMPGTAQPAGAASGREAEGAAAGRTAVPAGAPTPDAEWSHPDTRPLPDDHAGTAP